MAEWETKRQVLAALLAPRLGLGDPAGLNAYERATLEREVEALAERADSSAPEPTDPEAARLHRAAAEYRAACQLRADEDNVRLAERGEVFAPEDDA
ncbi:hypothetical protein ASG52_09315 [Methylobacterium sp. Leaf456]|uniref:hypothetical protein n=1 Tax=Methylobacterium sp. Leaf456 TaxID=1736382 RepID=UPI0006FB7FB6|nr:hypothetical protein [Methylobacterium sp. Leaf456]KQT49162.1 hypothetical protein ASG52_09315 [Methylobacterium sp. Leaf456]